MAYILTYHQSVCDATQWDSGGYSQHLYFVAFATAFVTTCQVVDLFGR